MESEEMGILQIAARLVFFSLLICVNEMEMKIDNAYFNTLVLFGCPFVQQHRGVLCTLDANSGFWKNPMTESRHSIYCPLVPLSVGYDIKYATLGIGNVKSRAHSSFFFHYLCVSEADTDNRSCWKCVKWIFISFQKYFFSIGFVVF